MGLLHARVLLCGDARARCPRRRSAGWRQVAHVGRRGGEVIEIVDVHGVGAVTPAEDFEVDAVTATSLQSTDRKTRDRLEEARFCHNITELKIGGAVPLAHQLAVAEFRFLRIVGPVPA